MHRLKLRSLTVLGLLLVTALLSEGCRRGPYLWVQQARYKPALPAYMVKAYRGRAIHLMPFVNRTGSRYYYYSPNYAIKYETSPSVTGFLRACFIKGLKAAGATVYPRPTPNVPSLRLVLQRMNDQQMIFDAYLYLNRRPIFQQRFTVNRPPARGYNTKHLEEMAFYQVNLAIAKLFMDRGFWQRFFGVSRAAPTTPGTPPGTPPSKKPAPLPGSTPPPGPTPAPGTTPAPGPTPPPAPGGP